MIERADVMALLEAAPVVYLATVSGREPRIRAVDNLRNGARHPQSSSFCREERFTCYFGTSGGSGKVGDIHSNPAVAAYYCDPSQGRGVTVSGEAEVLADVELKRTLWNESWRIYWKGPDDPDYVVVRLKAKDIRGWWGTTRFLLEGSGW